MSSAFGAVPELQGGRSPLRPAWFPVYTSSRSFRSFRLPPFRVLGLATLGTGSWLNLTRLGLSPYKKAPSFLGVQRHAAHGRPVNQLLTSAEVAKSTPATDGRYACGVPCSGFVLRLFLIFASLFSGFGCFCSSSASLRVLSWLCGASTVPIWLRQGSAECSVDRYSCAYFLIGIVELIEIERISPEGSKKTCLSLNNSWVCVYFCSDM